MGTRTVRLQPGTDTRSSAHLPCQARAGQGIRQGGDHFVPALPMPEVSRLGPTLKLKTSAMSPPKRSMVPLQSPAELPTIAETHQLKTQMPTRRRPPPLPNHTNESCARRPGGSGAQSLVKEIKVLIVTGAAAAKVEAITRIRHVEGQAGICRTPTACVIALP